MKSLISIFFFLLFSTLVFSQKNSSSKHLTIKFDVYQLVLNTNYGSIEFKVDKHQSIQLSPFYIDNRQAFLNWSSQAIQEHYSGWGANLEWRFYNKKKRVLNGGYLGPYFKFELVEVTREDPYGGTKELGSYLTSDRTKLSLGLMFGGQKINKLLGLCINYYCGIGLSNEEEDNFKGLMSNYDNERISPLEIRLGLSLGLGI
ncbi:MAG: hypothetical protein ACPGSD_12785 [Flavobacteriales bacterium]